MAGNLQVGERVYVPCARIPELRDRGVALYETQVVYVQGQRARVDLPGGVASDWIGFPLLHRNVGILIINVGDFFSEHGLLDPLAKSVGQFCRLLVPEDQMRQVRVRSLAELENLWQREQSLYSHVVWVGHGSRNGMNFAVDGWVAPALLNRTLRLRGAPRKTYISLCCEHGYKSYGAEISRSTICSDFIGPFHSVPGATASQFCQTFLASHLLEGRTVGVAFRHAREGVPGTASFRLWRAGRLKAGPR